MIDFEHSLKEFKKYLEQFDCNNGKIQLKIRHTYGVVKASEYISSKLELDKENYELARLIALLHDIGRFEQLKQSNSFSDSNEIDHVILGNKILFEDNLISYFLDDRKYDQIISKAILNHNKLKVDDDLSDIELLHSKIIRDADKTDNFRVKAEEKIEDIMDNCNQKLLENSTISDEIYNDFMNNKIIIHNKRKTYLDFWISYIAFIFDFNYNSGLEYIDNLNYINTIVNRLNYQDSDVKNKMQKIKEHALDYINKRK